MNLRKRLITIGVIGFVFLVITGIVLLYRPAQAGEGETAISIAGKETIYIWYTDEALTAYLSSAAVAYGEKNEDVRVIPVLESGSGYLEQINASSLSGECPDLYVASHDSLEKAYLAGLAAPVQISGRILPEDLYPQTALDAVSYKGKLLAYPFYFETSSLLYNRTYLEEMARRQLENEVNEAIAMESLEKLEEFGPEGGEDEGMPDLTFEAPAEGETFSEQELKMIRQKVEEIIPETIEDIKSFADEYDAPEQVEAVFKWDVNDIFYNYFFLGDSIVVGGQTGDDKNNIDIYNQKSIHSMRMYQELNQFFAIDTKEVSYSQILDDFISGKIVFTVATSDAVGKLERAREDGMFAYEYGVSNTPDINEETRTRSLSMTGCVVVNAYSEQETIANDFAAFLTTEYTQSLYARTGKVGAAYGVDYGYDKLDAFFDEYTESIPMPKMIETSNFWINLEITFARIWDGADVNRELKGLSEQIMTQITGQPYEEEPIAEDLEEEAPVEYLDEELYRQEAMEEENS